VDINIYVYANWLIYQSTCILSNMHAIRTVYKNIIITVPSPCWPVALLDLIILEVISAVTF